MQMAFFHAVPREGMCRKVTDLGLVLRCPYTNSDSIVHSAVKIPLVKPARLEHTSTSSSPTTLG